MTYQHGLPFNQRVERKDKVKPSSLGSGTKHKSLQQSHVKGGRQESETRSRIRQLKFISPSGKSGAENKIQQKIKKEKKKSGTG